MKKDQTLIVTTLEESKFELLFNLEQLEDRLEMSGGVGNPCPPYTTPPSM